MKLTVDASVVVKWFVAEPLCHEARIMLARRIDLYAPDLVLPEFANTIWKKTRRKEIPGEEPYLAELSCLPDIISLFPDRDLVERAARMAFAIDHPLYDCLYLACAEATESNLITADKRLANKPVAQTVGVRVEYLGDADVARQLEVAAFAPVIKRQKVDELINAFDLFSKTEQHVLDKLFPGTEKLRITTEKDREFFLNSPSHKRLVSIIKELDDKEYVDLLALGWFGAGLFPNWRRSVEHAEHIVLIDGFNPNYASQYGRHWQAGFDLVAPETIPRFELC